MTIAGRLRQISSKNSTLQVISIALVVTAFLYPSATQYNIPGTISSLLGMSIFRLWCIVLGLTAMYTFMRPERLPILAIVMIPFYYALIDLLLRGVTGTALLYYSCIVIFGGMLWADHQGIELKYVTPRLVGVVFSGTMFVVLLWNPDGSGLNYLYNLTQPIAPEGVHPSTMWQLGYALATIGFCVGAILSLLHIHIVMDQLMMLFLSVPFLAHGMVFAYVTVFVTQAFAFTPFFMLVTYLWIKVMERYSNE